MLAGSRVKSFAQAVASAKLMEANLMHPKLLGMSRQPLVSQCVFALSAPPSPILIACRHSLKVADLFIAHKDSFIPR